jgi:phosphatidylinositol 4-kinase
MESLLELRFRDRLYTTAFDWFSARPQWSYGSDRIQVGAEIKLLSEFLGIVQSDHIRGDHLTTSMPDRGPKFLVKGRSDFMIQLSVYHADSIGYSSLDDYVSQHRDRVRILQLLVESEVYRLSVWHNSLEEPNRATSTAPMEKAITPDDWTRLVQKAWKMSPPMTVHMGERFKYPAVQTEITRLVRANPKAVIGVPEALHFLLGDKLETASRRALQVSRGRDIMVLSVSRG